MGAMERYGPIDVLVCVLTICDGRWVSGCGGLGAYRIRSIGYGGCGLWNHNAVMCRCHLLRSNRGRSDS